MKTPHFHLLGRLTGKGALTQEGIMAHAHKNLQQNPQANLFSAAEEAALYHSSNTGFFTLNNRRGGRMRQTAHRLDQMSNVINLLDSRYDNWISQAEFFKPNRRVVNLARIGLLFVDVDYYNSKYAHLKPDAVLFLIWHYLDEVDLPPPSLVIDSGKGLQLKWILDKPIPRQALPRWNACQRSLVNALKDFGADPQAKDASRILRVVQTINSKNGRLVKVIHAPNFKYNFDEIAEQILPVAREQIEKKREQEKNKREQLKLINGGLNTSGLNRFSPRRLSWDRLEDLRKLAKMRNGVSEGERMKHLAWQTNFLLLSGATNSNQMWHEAAALAREIDPNWGYRSAELTTIFQKAKAAEHGEKVVFNGVEYSPLYTPKNQTLIDLFQIEPDEERQLRTIISKAEAAKRHREREEKRRREAGAMDRQIYQSNAQAKREQARELRSQGKSWKEVAEIAGYKNATTARLSCK